MRQPEAACAPLLWHSGCDGDRRGLKSGLDVPPSPHEDDRAEGGPGEQADQRWPGTEEPMRPAPDHGEESYVGWGRPAQPAELAPAFVFMASADSRYCTGEVLAITGMTASR